MERLKPNLRFKLDRVDVMLGLSLAVIVSSYALGYKLDWTQLDPKEEAELEDALEAGTAQAAAEVGAEVVMRAAPPETPEMAPRPEPTISMAPSDQAWEEMTRQLDILAAHRRARVAVHLKDLKTNREWNYHPDDLFPSASLVKVPVMCAVFFKMKDGGLSLNQQLTLRRRNRVGGSGSLKWQRDGQRFTVRELLVRMISESDNTATDMLIEAIGMGYIQQVFPKMGLLYTGIYREGMSIKGGRVAHENYTTAREMSMLMEKIYRGEMVDLASSVMMMDILKHRRPASRLAKGLPKGWEIGHKTGLLRQACHDTAVFFTPRGDYALTVLTGSNGNYKDAKDFITRLGHITFAHYGGYPRHRYIARAGRRSLALR
jgi:beta-lactamase class A